MSKPSVSPQQYWSGQLRRTLLLMAVWAIVSLVMSILFIEQLNNFSFFGVPFGFWMAQQGSIYVFLALIFIYAKTSDNADVAAGLVETEDTMSAAGEGH